MGMLPRDGVKMTKGQIKAWGWGLLAGLGLWGMGMPQAIAIPGQPLALAEVWIRNHPTLRPRPQERFIINRSETPARRFRFRASVVPVTGLGTPFPALGIIRTEEITFTDVTATGVTTTQLEESLRVIYDVALYNDFRRSRSLLRYDTAQFPVGDLRTRSRIRGELRQGERFGYWLEVEGPPLGIANRGTIAVFLLEDLETLQASLQRTYGDPQ